MTHRREFRTAGFSTGTISPLLVWTTTRAALVPSASSLTTSFPRYFPAEESAGTSFAQSGDGARLLPDWLPVFPGRFVALSFGTTDADFFDAGKPELPGDFYKNYEIMVKAVLAAGKTPVVPKIPYGRTEKILANGPASMPRSTNSMQPTLRSSPAPTSGVSSEGTRT